MTADEYRTIALGFPEASEDAHMDHPDFRAKGKIFATLGPEEDWEGAQSDAGAAGVFDSRRAA